MMGKKFAPLTCVVLIAGCGTPPEGTSENDVNAFLAAAASIGCDLVHDSDYAPVEFQAGLSRQQALDISGFLLAKGDAQSLPDGGVRITAGACAST